VSVGCIAEIDALDKAVLVVISPIVVILLITLFFVVPLRIMDSRDFSDHDKLRHRREELRIQFVRLALFTVFLFYPHLSSVVFGVYNCIDVGGTSLLVADVGIICGQTRQMSYAVGMIGFVLLYPIGIPCIYYFMLRTRRRNRELRSPKSLVMLGFLYNAYSDEAWYFELVDMTFKLCVTSGLPFLPHHLELKAAMLSVCAYLMIVLFAKPYVRKGDDRLQILVLAELVIMAQVGVILSIEGNYGEIIDHLLSMFLISLTILCFIVFCVMAFRNCLKTVRASMRRRHIKQTNGEGTTISLTFSTDPERISASYNPRSPASTKSPTTMI